MKVKHSDEEPIYFDHYNPEALLRIITTQHKVIEFQKKQNHKKLFSVLVIVDDFADSTEVSRQSKLLHSLYTRGRHNSISTITSTQKYSALAPIIRVNATEMYVYRLRNYKDLEAFVEEVSAVADKKTILDIYSMATREPYSFLYVNLRATDRNQLFHIRFDKRIEVED